MCLSTCMLRSASELIGWEVDCSCMAAPPVACGGDCAYAPVMMNADATIAVMVVFTEILLGNVGPGWVSFDTEFVRTRNAGATLVAEVSFGFWVFCRRVGSAWLIAGYGMSYLEDAFDHIGRAPSVRCRTVPL